MQTVFEIVIVSRKDLSIFETLYQSGRWIESYFNMSFISWGPGNFNVYFKGNVSKIVEETITRLLLKKFGTKLILIKV